MGSTGGSYNPSAGGTGNALAGVTYNPVTKQLIDGDGNPIDLSDLEEGPFRDAFGNEIPQQ